MIVEDELLIAQNMKEILEANNYEVTNICSSVGQAIFKFFGNRPDLILLDIKLKGESTGIDFAKKISLTYDVPTIFITANSDQSTIKEALKTNPYVFLTKPIQEKELLLNVELSLNRAKHHLEIKQEEEKMLRITQLQNMGEYFGGLVHDIINPLMSLKSKIIEQERINKKISKDIDEKIDHAINIVKNFKSLADQQEQELTVNSLKDIFHVALSITSYHLSVHGITLKIPDDLPSLTCNKTMLTQIITNLIKNSIDSIENLQEKWIRVNLKETDTQYKLIITDSGEGIAPNIRDRIFDPLFTTKNIDKGTGLGLYSAKKGMERMNGNIIYNKDSINTEFILIFNK